MQNQIFNYLKQTEGYISGEDISQQLKISRTAIWKNIEELRKDGYDIVAVPHLGYKLVSSPDKLFPHEVLHGLQTKIIGKNFIHHDMLTSTMDHAFQLGVSGAVEGTVVCTEGQSKGRGRMERPWVSPKGKGLYFSLILRPNIFPSEAAKITLFSAVAICEAIFKSTGVNVHIKWPNDLLIHNKKCAGILTELRAETDRVRFIVIGVGINVNTSMKYLPATATSLKHETGKNWSRVVLMQDIFRSIEYWYEILNKHGFEPVIQRWRQLSSTIGKKVVVGHVKGKAIDLDEHGGLIVQNDSGEKFRCMTGDVVQV
ncbi:MAG: biotin--[acetyl-CoA-carboxylase] ligase [Candidatus Omnitrophica bacterium]|nr:biotin--[acetyl-CoA-carboxylase] ligase [Candidatus Omnitrophota bacterium]